MLHWLFIYLLKIEILQEELQSKTGIDLKQEMAKKLKEMEVQWRKEKEEANETFKQERKVMYLHVNALPLTYFNMQSHLLSAK